METPAQGDVILDKYTVERKLGRGGMGVVVAARHRHLGELLALKFITGMCTPEAQERFWREGRAGAQLRGQHIARVYDMGQLPNGAPYMVMEYLRGLDLKTLLNRDGPFPFADAIRYILQACEALAEAHDAGIIHRDIKPSNLFLWDRPYGDPCIKVLDFGISKHRFHDDETLTLTKGFLGSPQYMAPEQIASPKNVDARADIWSLGVVLYEIITGTSPFQAASIVGIINKVVKDEPTPLRDYGLDVPAAIESVIKRCLRKSADDRFQSIEDLAEALGDVQDELTAPQTRRQSATITPLERLPERGQPAMEQAQDKPAAKEAVPPQAKDRPEEPRILPNLVELSTVKMRDEVVQPNDSEPEDEPTRAMAPQNNAPPKAAGVDEKGAPRMAAQSTPDGTIILRPSPLEWDSSDLATRKNIQPLEETALPTDTEAELPRELRRPRFNRIGVIVAMLAVLIGGPLVYFLQNASASDPPSSAITPFQGGDVSSSDPSTARSAGSAKAEPIEPAPRPPEATVTPSASANTEKPPPPKTALARPTLEKDYSTVPRTVPSPLPAPTAMEKDKPLPQNDKLQPSTKKPRPKRWTGTTDPVPF